MTMPTIPTVPGPAVWSLDPWVAGEPSPGRMRQLLSDDERARLAVIASVVRFKKGETIYRAGSLAKAIFNITGGVVKTLAPAAAGRDHIAAFLFPDDVFGLSQEGRYANSAVAVTAVTAYQIPAAALRARLSKDASLEYHVICKLCQELRQAQRHAFLLASRHATSRLALFLQMLEQMQVAKGGPAAEVYVPMDRSAIADYVGMPLATVSRTFRALAGRGVIRFRDRRHVQILDRDAFEKIANNGSLAA